MNHKQTCKRFLDNAIKENDVQNIRKYLKIMDNLRNNSQEFNNIYKSNMKQLRQQQRGGSFGGNNDETSNWVQAAASAPSVAR
jgi:hypothetical protein